MVVSVLVVVMHPSPGDPVAVFGVLGVVAGRGVRVG